MACVLVFGAARWTQEFTSAANSTETTEVTCVQVPLKFENSAQGDRVQSVPRRARVHGIVVDEAGKPLPGVEVRAINLEGRQSLGVTDPNGQFDFLLSSGRLDGTFLRAFVKDGSRQGIHQYAYLLTTVELKQPARIVLKPSRAVTLCVVGQGGKPIADAAVGFIVNDNPISGGRTDAGGRWAVRVPVDWYQWCAFSFKSNVGFDYAGIRQPQNGGQTVNRPLPDNLTLTLDGARTERVKAMHRDGKPIAGVRFAPHILTKAGREPFNNWLDRTWELWPATGIDGVITLDWLPREFGKSMPLSGYADGLHAVGPMWIMAGEPSDLVTVTFLPMEYISGRVTHADGRPAVDVLVSSRGQGSHAMSIPSPARTDADGHYEIRAESEQAYIVEVDDKEWAAPFRGNVVLRAGKPAVAVDFMLRRVTRLHGRVTAGKDGRPVSKTWIMLVIDMGEVPAEIRLGGKRNIEHVRKTNFAETDEGGHYEFRVGPGEYQLEGLDRLEPIKLRIPDDNAPLEFNHDIRIPDPGVASEMHRLSGRPDGT